MILNQAIDFSDLYRDNKNLSLIRVMKMAALAFWFPINVPRDFDAITDLELNAIQNSSTLLINVLYFENSWNCRSIKFGARLYPDPQIYL